MTPNEMLAMIAQLRRQRDEARHKLELCMAANSDVARIAKERDEARTERDSLQVMRKEVVAANKGAKINAQVSNSLAGKLNQAERERDEAIIKYTEEANEFERQRNHVIAECEEARRERDEARNRLADALQEVDCRTLDYERIKEQNAKLRDIADRAIIPLECDGVPWGAKLRAELDQLKEGAK